MSEKVPHCVNCPVCNSARKNPQSLFSRIVRWHQRWCPGYKSYQRWLKEHPEFVPADSLRK
jgi:hypothetical protein